MKKIWEWLSGNVIKDVGEVIDNLTTTDEEKLQIKKALDYGGPGLLHPRI